ncbi:MAG: hypothetical protein F4051_00300 [Boseongicola sp. SB0670_bin_30]|nr:hypothetical protein [Boseongicola sp. SB0670_bin_30]
MNENYAQQIIETFKGSSLERILVIDDAYDAPEFEFDAQFCGAILDKLTAEDLREQVPEQVLGEDALDDAIEALEGGDWQDDAISRAAAALFHVFIESRHGSVDPGGVFAATKGAALDALDPLLELLNRCSDDPKIEKVGKGTALDASKAFRPDLIFMDFFLSPPERITEQLTKGQADYDRASSIKVLESILKELADCVPAVVLMSSADVANRKDAYLKSVGDRVMALRSGFLLKSWVQGHGQDLTASGDAADVLMDTSGSFEFGRALETALKAWKVGAKEALEKLNSDLQEFDVKDFAYLLRFRLYDEGEPFADYLEWFLGESLRAIVDDKVDWENSEFPRLNDQALTGAIEGAHPFPSQRLAKFFHRLRFNSRETRPRGRFALGDVFVSPNHKRVRMVISPDCDLVPRNENPAAARIVTIGGSIRGLHEAHAWAGELIFHNSPRAIKWNNKDLMTHEFGDCSSLLVDGKPYEYFASLRQMPAQTIQKAVLADLSRVGLAVPPTVDFGAPVTVYLKKMDGHQAKPVKLEGLKEPRVQAFMPRGGKELKTRVLFTPKFYRDLRARLQGLSEDDLHSDDRDNWKDWLAQAEDVRATMLRKGLEAPGEGKHDVWISVGKPKKKSWLEIVIDTSEDALIQMHGTELY